MSFQSYIANIQAKTGKTPDEFRALADAKGFSAGGALKPNIKAGQAPRSSERFKTKTTMAVPFPAMIPRGIFGTSAHMTLGKRMHDSGST